MFFSTDHSVPTRPAAAARATTTNINGALLALLLAAPTALAAEETALAEPPITPADRQHWAFQPLKRPDVPQVANANQARNPIDHFILRRLEEAGLKLMPQADRRTLIRRLSLDLTGLPPTPAEVEAFVNDTAPDAYEALVDRLLASPAYGERWGQHWLDLARFAETDGFELDQFRPNAWRYRDWVVNALNEDVPYDAFVRLQLAGDELRPGDEEAALATGFLLSGPDMPDINDMAERRHMVLNEITDTVGKSLLGLGLGCAQCHDHKFDPVSQADFYRMRAFFANTIFPKRYSQLGHRITEPDATPPPTHLMIRGDYKRPGAELRPAFLRIANPGSKAPAIPEPSKDADTSGRRTALAQWISRRDNPLPLRVVANRLWMHHFGAPIVGTPNDFGLQGLPPTHPDLLDWLATELPRQGWSLKDMHRLIVGSATYRQQSHGDGPAWKKAYARDRENVLLSRMNRNRLQGEILRDAMLAATGALNPKKGGPGIRPPLPEEITITLLRNQWNVTPEKEEHYRRSLYIFARRNMAYPMFDLFDRPSANASCARRHESTTAPQSLTLLNSGFSFEMAQRLSGATLAALTKAPATATNTPTTTEGTANAAAKNPATAAGPPTAEVTAAGDGSPAATAAGDGDDLAATGPATATVGHPAGRDPWLTRIAHAYRLTLSRPPTADESATALAFLNAQATQLKTANRTPDTLATPIPAPKRSAPTGTAHEEAAFIDFCLALFNLNEFIYVD